MKIKHPIELSIRGPEAILYLSYFGHLFKVFNLKNSLPSLNTVAKFPMLQQYFTTPNLFQLPSSISALDYPFYLRLHLTFQKVLE